MSGVVWADTNRNQVRDAGELVKSGVTVELVSSPGGAVIATTTSSAQGAYSFANVADGGFVVRATAPVQFTFPATRAGDNDFASTGAPAPGQPQQGATVPFTITGATQVTGLDAGMQPLAAIQVVPTPQDNACQGLITTGTPPFDATDGGGLDSSAANCLVRTNDSTTQLFSVSLTGLPTGGSVTNVVLDITASSADGARFQFTGPQSGGLPTGCLTTGVSPASNITNNPDGTVTLHCNMGTFTSAVGIVQVPVTPLGNSINNSHFRLVATARAAGGDAIASNVVTNPDVQVTGLPRWDVSKSNFGSTATPTTRTINGQSRTGYLLAFLIVFSPTGGLRGQTGLTSPLTFTDQLSIPGAIFDSCGPTQNGGGTGIGATPGTMTCPTQGTPAGSSTTFTIQGMSSQQTSGYHVRWFLPLEDAYRLIDPTWDPGEPIPTGNIPVSNSVINTQGYTDAGGNLNYGTSATPGFEPGWNGTTASGNNVTSIGPLQVRPPAPGIPGSGKSYWSTLGGCCTPEANAGGTTGTQVVLNTDAQTTVVNPILVDVFDVSVWQIASLPAAPAGYLLEYAIGPNTTNTQAGPPVNGVYPFNSTDLKAAASIGNQVPGPYTWASDPTSFGANWRDTVNMVRMRPINPTTFLPPSSSLRLAFVLTARSIYNGGPNAGQEIPAGVRSINEGGWTDPTKAENWSTGEALLAFNPYRVSVSKSAPQAQYLPGDAVPWTVRPVIFAGGPGGIVNQVVVTDRLPANLEIDVTCTQNALPAGVTLAYNPVNRQATFSYGDVTIPQSGVPYNLPPFTVCTRVSTLANPGAQLTNPVSITTPDAPTATGSALITINGSGQLAIQKSVDRPLIGVGQTFTWRIDWSNTTTAIPFQAPDLIDVLPWNGDGADGSLSKRDQYDSDYTGTTGITGALAQPTYTTGATGNVPGTWYYATAAPATISHDARDATNADPAAAGGLWQTAAEITAGAGFGAVTAVRFVSSTPLAQGQSVRALLPSTATPSVVDGDTVLDGLYVNRSMIFSGTFAQQPLPSNEPYVLMPGFTMGDLVWLDRNADGVFDSGDEPVAGVPIEILDANGGVVQTPTTNAGGRWVASGLKAGTYRARIPASAFGDGAPLDGTQVLSNGSSTNMAIGEGQGNKNTAAPEPAVSGLTSAPVTFAYTTSADGSITGGNQPPQAAADPGGLLDPLLPAGFMNMNVDLAATPLADISIVKSADTDEITEVGQVVGYSFLVENTGELALTNVGVTDTQTPPAGALDAAPVCADTTLDPGETTTCTATYTVTQADIDNGRVDDSAASFGTPPGGLPLVQSEPDALSIPVTDAEASIALEKSADTDEITAAGQVVGYSFEVTNTGDLTLTGVSVTDVQIAPAGDLDAAPVCDSTTLAPGESTTCRATYIVTQADIDNGKIDDTATAAGNPPGNAPAVESEPADLSIPVTGQVPSISIEKSADRAEFTAVGQLVTYSFLVTNTGDLTLSEVSVDDVQAPPAGALDAQPVCLATSLAPGAQTTCTATYTATQADIDHGRVDDTARAIGTPPAGGVVESAPDDLSIPVAGQTASIALDKSASVQTIDALGQTVIYSFLVTNTGTLTLTGVFVTDVPLAPAGPLDGPVDCPVTTLAPGASTTCTAEYTVTQEDLDHGRVDDTATATGTPPGAAAPVVSPEDSVSIPVDATASITLDKTADRTTIDEVGQIVTYSFLVTNTGELTLHDIVVSDQQLAPAGSLNGPVTCPETTLEPLESTTCTATYTVTQADLDHGRVDDTAAAQGIPPDDGAPVVSAPDQVSIPVTGQVPSISIEKSADLEEITAVGDVVTYTFVVTNTGDLTLTEVGVEDVQTPPAGTLDAAPTCLVTTLAPGASTTCTATYTATQADVDNGRIDDTATSVGSPPNGAFRVRSTPDAVSIPVTDQSASIALVKSSDTDEITTLGQVVGYSFDVTNTGTLTLANVGVADVQAPPAGALDADPVCAETTLAPGQTTTCTATYTVTQADLDNGRLDDTATAHGSPPGDAAQVVSEPDDVSIPVTGQTRSLTIVKTADATRLTAAGQVIVYGFVVTNTGTLTLTDVAVEDNQEFSEDVLSAPPACPQTTLAPGESMTCHATMIVSPTAYERGRIGDTATATAFGGAEGLTVESGESSVQLNAPPAPPSSPPAASGGLPRRVSAHRGRVSPSRFSSSSAAHCSS
ncbi:DUF11 domain-containing protein [Microbacterium sp. 4R-513]|uniref:DUF7507 domain-containing protein n=1 Tax=Microbacterium sp. 4R-513 TaxID=2567934 RepID=UPI0013E13C5A|nr:SdrD B-like domain-containing protein [Microbacterium sp. 4R-513]QIG39556.1 DUF11 domain-containing protein [Microbacterium sp. 4R-513]